jgi:hypothetical protein
LLLEPQRRVDRWPAVGTAFANPVCAAVISRAALIVTTVMTNWEEGEE